MVDTVGMGGGGGGRRRGGGWWGSKKMGTRTPGIRSLKRSKDKNKKKMGDTSRNKFDPKLDAAYDRLKKTLDNPPSAKFKEAISKAMLTAKPGGSMPVHVTGRNWGGSAVAKPGSTMPVKSTGKKGVKPPPKSRRMGKVEKAAAGAALAGTIYAAATKEDKKSKKKKPNKK